MKWSQFDLDAYNSKRVDFDTFKNKTIWGANKLPDPIPEYKFNQSRKWRIDFAFPEVKLAIEIEGGVWSMGRHNHPSGFIKDMEKYNALTEAGWYLLRYQPKKIDYEQIKRVYEQIKKPETNRASTTIKKEY